MTAILTKESIHLSLNTIAELRPNLIKAVADTTADGKSFTRFELYGFKESAIPGGLIGVLQDGTFIGEHISKGLLLSWLFTILPIEDIYWEIAGTSYSIGVTLRKDYGYQGIGHARKEEGGIVTALSAALAELLKESK